MKRFLALCLGVGILAALAGCGGGGPEGSSAAAEGSVSRDPLEVLNTVWESYGEDEKFPAAGGDMSEENSVMDGPGVFDLGDAELLDSYLAFPAGSADQLAKAACLVHMMNANTFTCGAYQVKDAGGEKALAETVEASLKDRQWICGFPEELRIARVDDVLVVCFGAKDLVESFEEKLSAAYSQAEILFSEPLA